MTADSLTEIKHFRSSARYLSTLIVGLTMGLVSLGIATGIISQDAFPKMPIALAWTSGVFFTFGTFLAAGKLFRLRDPVITLSAEGISNSDRPRQIIPWTKVRSAEIVRLPQGASMATLIVDPEFLQSLPQTRVQRIFAPVSSAMTKAMQLEGVVALDTAGLLVGKETIIKQCRAFMTAYGEGKSDV